MIVFGVDPGMTGALAMIDDTHCDVWDLPLMRDKSLAWIDCNDLFGKIFDWRSGRPASIWIERQGCRPGQGAGSVFKSGMVFGSIIAAAQASGCPLHFVTPVTWKRSLGLSQDKNASLDKARLLYPTIELDRKKDHNRAEAVLIAHYGMSQVAR